MMQLSHRAVARITSSAMMCAYRPSKSFCLRLKKRMHWAGFRPAQRLSLRPAPAAELSDEMPVPAPPTAASDDDADAAPAAL